MTQQRRANLNNVSQAYYRQSQCGMGMWGLLVVMGIAVFFATIAFKVGPSYSEYWTVQQVAADTAAKTELLRGPKSKVYESISAGFRQNNLWDAEAKEMIRLEKDASRGMAVHVDYESRTLLFGNVYVVTKFKKEVSAR